YSRAIIDAIHDGSLAEAEFETYPIFGLQIPKAMANVPSDVLNPATAWKESSTPEEFNNTVRKLATLFNENFDKYSSEASEEVIAAGPKL
ncbi:Protein kinase C-like 1, partial [Podila epigama]